MLPHQASNIFFLERRVEAVERQLEPPSKISIQNFDPEIVPEFRSRISIQNFDPEFRFRFQFPTRRLEPPDSKKKQIIQQIQKIKFLKCANPNKRNLIRHHKQNQPTIRQLDSMMVFGG
jgi:hypothetical protein